MKIITHPLYWQGCVIIVMMKCSLANSIGTGQSNDALPFYHIEPEETTLSPS
jgi:hypothetical protein